MKGLVSVLLCSLLIGVYSQTVVPILSADFESGVLPAGWRKSQNATAIGWLVGTTDALSSTYFAIPSRTGNVAVDNDDGCGPNCDGFFDVLDTPAFTQDPSIGETFVQFDSFYTGQYGQQAMLAYSVTGVDGNYVQWADLPPSDPIGATWQRVTFNLPPLQANSSVSVRFWSSDDDAWAGGWAIDNVLIAQNNWTGVVPQCAVLNNPTNGSGIPVSGGSISWTGSHARFPFGYYVHLGTDFPPTDLVNHQDVRRATSFALPDLQSGLTYNFQVIPYGKDNLQAVDCPVWSFVASLPPSTLPTAPYFQDFENDYGGWVAGGSLSSWAYGTPNKTVIQTAHSGTKVWVSGGLTGQYNNREQSWVQSPVFSFANINSSLFVSFWIFSDLETSFDGVKFQLSLDSTTWLDVGIFGDTNWYNDYTITGLPSRSDGWTSTFTSWRMASHFLPQEVIGASQVSFRFFMGADGSIVRGGFAFDDFQIDVVPTGPPLCSELGYPALGDDDIATRLSLTWARPANEHPLLPVGMLVRFGTDNPPTNIYNDRDMLLATSVETPELTPQTTYYWQVVPYGFSGVRASCPVWNFTVISVQTTFPYVQDFENGEGGWAPLGNRSSWTFGTPNKVNSIVGCGSGSSCWVNGGLTGLYSNSESSYVVSPTFDFTSLLYDPLIVLKVFWEVEKDYDGANVQYQSTNGSWLTVGTTLDGNNWYTSSNIRGNPGGSPYGWTGANGVGSNRWLVASNELVGLAGKQTKLRIAFGSDSSLVDDGFAFDDIKILPAPVGVIPDCVSPIYPPNGAVNIAVPATFNIQWDRNSTTVGLPRGFTFKYGLTNPPQNSINTGDLSTFPVVNVSLARSTTYYWQVIPYGYEGLPAVNCPVWSFSTVVGPPTSAPTSPLTSAPTSAPTLPATSAASSAFTQTTPASSAPSQRSSAQPGRTSSPPINGDSSSSKGGSSKGAVAAAVIIPLLVLIVIIIVAAILYSKFSKKSIAKKSKLEAAERELDEKGRA